MLPVGCGKEMVGERQQRLQVRAMGPIFLGWAWALRRWDTADGSGSLHPDGASACRGDAWETARSHTWAQRAHSRRAVSTARPEAAGCTVCFS